MFAIFIVLGIYLAIEKWAKTQRQFKNWTCGVFILFAFAFHFGESFYTDMKHQLNESKLSNYSLTVVQEPVMIDEKFGVFVPDYSLVK